MVYLKILNVLFFIIHIGLIVFNLSGWAFKTLRKWHLISLSITAFSWFFLGLFYGWGYCFLTDWHFDVRRELGLIVDSHSYIHFLLKRLSIDFWSSQTTDMLTGVFFGLALLLSVLGNYFDRKMTA